jgi:hypothetical protein
MRLWSLHPAMLDRVGLVALWREGLLAQKVLLGQTKGYRFHPQLKRFQDCRDPVGAIGCYLRAVADEARVRGYSFDVTKIVKGKKAISIVVTDGQLEYELAHLLGKLQARDREKLRELKGRVASPHPMLRIVSGKVEPWEVV